MRFSFLLVVLLLLVSAPAAAQEVTGRVWIGNSGAAGAVVTVTCGDQARSATADGNGVYRVTAGTGECNIQVSFQSKASNRVGLRVAQGRTTANLELTARGSGWALTRRG
jgi:hypothetical protein